jgi:hypothetical protein
MENKAKPNPYSKTDKAEAEAILLFENLINNDFVKTDIKQRDKHPNIDGTIELVDTEKRPIGKFDVQIRKIPQDDIKYCCPTSLVAYSKVSTLPILLICCDVKNKRGYWKHIHLLMPEYREEQKTFTIKFREMDKIDKSEIYIKRWKDILFDYKQRISDYPRLKNVVDNNLSLSKINKTDIRYFQTYIDKINTLLDNDFACIKELFFPDIWKLGVGIHECSEEKIIYQLYKIELGDTYPLICIAEIGSLKQMRSRKNKAFYFHFSSRYSTSNPIDDAKNFISGYLETAFKQRLFAVHGTYLSTEVLFSFLNQYHKIFGLEKTMKYKMDDIEKGYYEFFPKACAAYMFGIQDFVGEIFIDIEQLNSFCTIHNSFPSCTKHNNVRWAFNFHQYLLKNIRDSIEYLNSNSIREIEYPLLSPEFGDKLQRHWIWSGYERTTEIHNISTILKNSLSEYETFVKGNRLMLTNSPYLDRGTAVVFCYKPTTGEDLWQSPVLTECHFNNEDNVLPRLTVIADEQIDKELNEIIKRINRQPIYFSTGFADFLFRKMPFVNMIYNMLMNDLERHYNLHLPIVAV